MTLSGAHIINNKRIYDIMFTNTRVDFTAKIHHSIACLLSIYKRKSLYECSKLTERHFDVPDDEINGKKSDCIYFHFPDLSTTT